MDTTPVLQRQVVLNLMGDWGYANLHRVCGWIASQVVPRCGAGSRVGIWTGDGWISNVRAVAEGTVDVALVTPASLAAMAVAGTGPFAGEPVPDLRALGVVPQFDRLVLAVRRDLGVGSFDELRRSRPPLRVSTAATDNLVGWAARLMMEASGVPESELQAWGGGYLDLAQEPPWSPARNSPHLFVERVRRGEADAVIFEAIMLPVWQEVARDPGLRFVPVEEDVLRRLESEAGWPRAVVPAGYFPGQDEPFATLDFAEFLVVGREDMPEDLAHLIAHCMGETRDLLERQYRHIPPERSPVTYPLDPARMGRAPIPLHPGAARYYERVATR
jgi:TRAP transporter TAXI family solute receptor